ncbi:MAG: DUF1553 domain-containing protein [Candidatus Omnitrophica bacterium]|nr:DUF1553 domain-containing protein [Candidatus Omnitrophota bacterium]
MPILGRFRFIFLVLAFLSFQFSYATEDQDPSGETITDILQGVRDIKTDPKRYEEALSWIEEEQAEVQKELEEIESLLTELNRKVKGAEEERQRLAREFALGVAVPGQIVQAAGGSQIDFTRDIRPILSNNCVKCHGPDGKSRKGGLRLDILNDALGGKGVIVPGDSPSSELIKRITTSDPADRMPPPESGKELKPDQIALLRDWINQGAVYEGHWAFQKPRKAPLPKVSKQEWVRNEIDSFVLAKLDEMGISPSEEADKHALVRRLFLDLIGLPPTPTEVDEFMNDDSPEAYEKLVDRLLASPHFGERWARVWLDLARYADTMGYEKDAQRTIWRYRDWVIQALNEDKPYDQFTIEQLAGDLLENPSQNQLIATAFHRNTMTNTEGGTDDEEFRNAAVVDRVNTTMEVWMGLTMGCAQCHSHKYDPITNTEYYKFFAFFNQTADNDQPDESPTLLSPNPEQKIRLDNLDRQIDLTKKLLDSTKEQLDLTQSDWETEAKSQFAATPRLSVWHSVGPFLESDYDLAKGGAFDAPFAPEQGVVLKETYNNGQIKWESRPAWTDGAVHQVTGEFSATYLYRTIECATDQPLRIQLGRTDRARLYLNGEKIQDFGQPEDKQLKTEGVEVSLVQGTNHLLIKLSNRKGESEFSFKTESQTLSEETWAALNLDADLRTAEQKTALRGFHQSVSPEFQRVSGILDDLNNERGELVKQIPTTPVMKELPKDERRETHVQVKGNFLNPGEEVSPGVPDAFNDFPKEANLNRLGLAKWLVSRDNPLTARVAVNRYWSKFFGRGLVETAEDFGTQGELPTNQALLDWLAVDFMENGWSLKQLCKTIVTSAAYRQTSKNRPELEEIDPLNRFLSRGPRFRLEAEMVRDQALRASGLLSSSLYGPSVMPPQPDGVWQVVYSGEQWNTSRGEDRYRRGLYTFWRRTSPYPSMVAFDAPSREICTSLRVRTNTPLQALVTLNDPVYIETAQALARRTAKQGGSVDSKLDFAFRCVLVRPPSEMETERLKALFQNELEHYQANFEEAKTLSTDPLGPVEDENLIPELAAWTTVGNVLLNLDETVTRL